MIRAARACSVALAILMLFPMSAMAGAGQQSRSWNTASDALAPGASFTPFGPIRIVDTRVALGLPSGLKDGVASTFKVAGVSGIPDDAVAVSGNLTVTAQNNGGYVALTTDPTNKPTTSTLNIPLSDTRANGVFISLSSTGYLSATSVGMSCSLIFDVTGYFTHDDTQSSWYPLVPARLLDTRFGVGLSGTFKFATPRTLQVTGYGGVPSNATAITGNLTVVNNQGLGYVAVTVQPTSKPGTSTLNFPAGDTRANNLTTPLATGGSISLVYMGSGTTDVVFDVTGYFVKDNNGALFVPIAPARVMDSRYAKGASGLFVSYKPATLALAGKNGIDSTVVAVAGNLTATDVSGMGYAYVVPKASGMPATSNLNVPLADIRANGFVSVLAGDQSLGVGYQAATGGADLVIDLTGYFVAPSRPVASAAFTSPAPGTSTDVSAAGETATWTTTGDVRSIALTQYSASSNGAACSSTWVAGWTITPTTTSSSYANYAPGHCYRYQISLNGDPTTTVISGVSRYSTAASKVPVLEYHRVSPTIDPGSQYPGLVVDPADFDAEMKAMHDNGWRTITAADLAYRMTNHLYIPDKSFVVTLDDGRDDGYYYAYPILKKYGFVATYFVITNREDTATNLSWDQCAEMARNGMEIASHTEDHADIALSHGTALVNEVSGSKTAIERNLAARGVTVTVTTFCYPYGDVTAEGEQYIKTHGYLAAFTEDAGAVRPAMNMYELPRVRVARGESGATLLQSVAQS